MILLLCYLDYMGKGVALQILICLVIFLNMLGFGGLSGRIQRLDLKVITYLFHSRAKIVDQLAFNLDVQQTLQLLHPSLLQNESVEVLEFLNGMNGNIPKKGMRQIDEHTYILGKPTQKQISEVESELLGIPSGIIPTFGQVYHNGSIYHSASYIKGKGKRNNQVCYFKSEGCQFGQIQLFTLDPPAAIVQVFEPSSSTILERAGYSCCPVLQEYKEIDFLSSFVHEIKPPRHYGELTVIPISQIEGKAVHLELQNSLFDYVL